jgi:hypothetical protein
MLTKRPYQVISPSKKYFQSTVIKANILITRVAEGYIPQLYENTELIETSIEIPQKEDKSNECNRPSQKKPAS